MWLVLISYLDNRAKLFLWNHIRIRHLSNEVSHCCLLHILLTVSFSSTETFCDFSNSVISFFVSLLLSFCPCDMEVVSYVPYISGIGQAITVNFGVCHLFRPVGDVLFQFMWSTTPTTYCILYDAQVKLFRFMKSVYVRDSLEFVWTF